MSYEAQHKDVCRDYLNKICTRGRNCRYYHPPRDDENFTEDDVSSLPKTTETDSNVDFSFCIDYQSNPRGCDRTICRYLHCSKESADRYQQTRKIDLELARAVSAAHPDIGEIDGKQLCKEFKYHRCTRGSACKFWHIQPLFEQERRYGLGRTSASIPLEEPISYPNYPQMDYYYPPKRSFRDEGFRYDEGYDRSIDHKRIRYTQENPISHHSQYSAQSYSSESETSLLMTENTQLKTTYETLLQTVNALKASNTQLLEENNSLRRAMDMSNEVVGVNPHRTDKGPDMDASLSVFPRLR